MGLFDLFKKGDKVGKDSAVDSKNLLGKSAGLSTKAGQKIKTKLSYHPDWNVPQEQQYIFNFLANDLEPLLPNQLSLAAISIDEDDKTGEWYVKAFFRSSLSQTIELGEIELMIIDKDDNVVAAEYFDFADLGAIPPESARPWIFKYPKDKITGEKPTEDWKITFNFFTLRDHMLDLDESWKKQLPEEEQAKLAEIVKSLPKLGKTEINFTGLQAKLRDDNSLYTSIFIRNGHSKAINIEQLPLEIYDANGGIVAKGSFKLNPILTIQPNTTKPWTFVFPAELVTAESADLSRWTARVPQ